MELTKTKYKQTEVGLIPEDWAFDIIGDQIDLLTGFPFPSSKYSSDGIRLLKGANVKRGETDWQDKLVTYWNEDINKYKQFELQADDLVIAMDGSLVGRSYALISTADLPAILLQRVARIRSKKIDIKFLKFFVGSDWFVKYCDSVKTVTAIPHISPKDIRCFKIPLPPTLTEQKAIATALCDVDELIANLDKLLTKKKAIKQGAMQQLLTPPHKGGKRLVGFTGEWVEKKLGEVAQMNSGGTPSSKVSEYYNGDINWVSITDMTNTGKYIISSGKKITEEGLHNSSARLFPKDTVLLAMYASIGKCTIAKAKVTTSQAILGITVNNSLDIEYLYYYLIYKKDELISQGQQGTQSNLNKGMVQNIIMCLPQIKEQNAIAKILSDMDSEIEQLETKKSKYGDIKQGMMQELLTGKTRLV